jgi:hypothetical protein
VITPVDRSREAECITLLATRAIFLDWALWAKAELMQSSAAPAKNIILLGTMVATFLNRECFNFKQ